jgi:hypothetical protein
MISERFCVLKTSKSLQTLGAEARLSEGQLLIAGKILDKEKSLRYRIGTRRPTVSRT